MSKISFRSQVAVVTGAGGGIGRAIAVLLAARGAAVVINNRTPGKADAVVAEIVAAGGTALANGEVVGDPGAGSRLAQAVLETFGGIDILVNNAGVAAHAPLADTTEDDIDCMVRVNVRGTIDVTRAMWPYMMARAYGRVLNVGSGASLGVARSAVYAATKAHNIGFTNCLAVEGRAAGIAVNAIFPMAATNLTTGTLAYKEWMARNFPPELVAVVASYLVSRDCAVNGLTFHVGGGKVGRLAIVGSRPGLFDPDLTPELIRDHLSKFRDVTDPLVITEAETAQHGYFITSEHPPPPAKEAGPPMPGRC